MKVLMTGATGLIGNKLVRALTSRGDQVVVLSRNPQSHAAQLLATTPRVTVQPVTDGATLKDTVDAVDAIVNLAGEKVIGKRWTADQRKAILNSRVKTTRMLSDAVERANKKPSVVVSASAIGYYGPHGSERLTEADLPGNDFLAEVCKHWEAAASDMRSAETRVVMARIGIVLDRDGGALEQMVRPFKFYGGGPLGDGSQWVSWVHIDDVIGLLLFALDTPKVQGPLNVTAPEALSNRDFSKVLGRVLGKPSWLPVPRFALKIALGDASAAVLTGQNVVPDAALRSGYQFKYPSCEEALRSLLTDSAPQPIAAS